MTPVQLKSIRRMLMLTTKEASEFIGFCTDRSWQRYEFGDRRISDRTITNIKACLKIRDHLINSGSSVYFDTYKEYKENVKKPTVLGWRINQSAYAQKLADKITKCD